MQSNEINQYIQAQRQSGKTDDLIHEELLKAGWHNDDIQYVLMNNVSPKRGDMNRGAGKRLFALLFLALPIISLPLSILLIQYSGLVFVSAFMKLFSGEAFQRSFSSGIQVLSEVTYYLLTSLVIPLWAIGSMLRWKKRALTLLWLLLGVGFVGPVIITIVRGDNPTYLFFSSNILLIAAALLYRSAYNDHVTVTQPSPTDRSWRNDRVLWIIAIIVLLSIFGFSWGIHKSDSAAQADMPEALRDIDQSVLGVSDSGYMDIRQAYRISQNWLLLRNHYVTSGSFPESLEEVFGDAYITDLITGEPYPYVVTRNNFTLTYSMNSEPEPLSDQLLELIPSFYEEYVGFAYGRYHLNVGDELWHTGVNTADRFSPIADTLQKRASETNAAVTDYELEQNINQYAILHETLRLLKDYPNETGQYPESLNGIEYKIMSSATSNILGGYGVICEDIFTHEPCEYASTPILVPNQRGPDNQPKRIPALRLSMTFTVPGSMIPISDNYKILPIAGETITMVEDIEPGVLVFTTGSATLGR